jgi:hypothetical protein
VMILGDSHPAKAVCSAMWALFVSVTLGAIFCVFLLFHTCGLEINDSPTRVESLVITPTTTCLSKS